MHTKGKSHNAVRTRRLSRYFSSDLPSECRPRGERLSEHPQRRLETRAQPEFCDGWIAIPLPRTECGRSFEQG